MKKAVIILIAALMFILGGCGEWEPDIRALTTAPDNQSPTGIRVKVNRVIDGDTFEIINRGQKERVRLIGMDTPESVKPGEKAEPWGVEAGRYTKNLIENRMVRLEFDVQKQDRYGRLLAYVYLEDGTLLNARLLEEGLAVVFTVPPNVKMADNFLEIQRQARAGKKGIWQ